MKLSLQPRAEVSIFIHNFVSARADEDLYVKTHKQLQAKSTNKTKLPNG